MLFAFLKKYYLLEALRNLRNFPSTQMGRPHLHFGFSHQFYCTTFTKSGSSAVDQTRIIQIKAQFYKKLFQPLN